MREKIKDKDRLYHIVTAIDDIFEFTKDTSIEDFKQNKMLKHAVYRNFTIIGEAANLLTKDFIEIHSEIQWRNIIGMRHVLVHGYYEADSDTVWQTVIEDLPLLKQKIENIITSLNL